MARKQKKTSPGAPLWMVTYGDMVTLLLTFFVMLASMANYGEINERFMAAIESIRQALGMQGQLGTKVDPSVDFHSMIKKLESIVKADQPRDRGDSREEGIYGKQFRLRRIRDGMEITIGGPILFEPFSAKLTERGQASLGQIGDVLKGHRNKVEIRGHAAEEPSPADWTYEDALELSFQRAKTVANELILRGVDPRTLVWVAVGANEPVARAVYDLAKRGQNRRVEIIVRESLIDDYLGQRPLPSMPTTQPTDTGTSKSSPSP